MKGPRKILDLGYHRLVRVAKREFVLEANHRDNLGNDAWAEVGYLNDETRSDSANQIPAHVLLQILERLSARRRRKTRRSAGILRGGSGVGRRK